MKKFTLCLVIVALLLSSSCGKKEEQTMTDENAMTSDSIIIDTNEVEEPPISIQINEEPIEEEPSEEVEIIDTSPEGMALSPITGLYVKEEESKKRPFAIMINNLSKALPQSGISQAEVIYETLAEGGITRLMGIFQSFDTEKIGPVRSSRDYYIDFAYDFGAIYVHHGGSPQAYDKLASTKYNNIDGIKLDGTTFQRDPVRVKQKGMYEHSSYTAASRLKEKAEAYKYPLTITDNFNFGFTFLNEGASRSDGASANNVMLAYSNIQKSEFIYSAETKLYSRVQNKKSQIDENTGEQVTTKNIIVQIAKISLIPGDKEGRLKIALVSSGKGYYITEGKAYPLTWSKSGNSSPTQYKNADGNLIQLSPGNSWICVFPDNEKILFDEVVVE